MTPYGRNYRLDRSRIFAEFFDWQESLDEDVQLPTATKRDIGCLNAVVTAHILDYTMGHSISKSIQDHTKIRFALRNHVAVLFLAALSCRPGGLVSPSGGERDAH